MSYTSNYNLNQRISYLESIISSLIPILPIDLANVLTNGNSAGANDIDLNNNDILQVNNINLSTINGSAYPPVVPADDLQAVLTAGNDAGGLNITNLNNLDVSTINGSAYPPAVEDLSTTLIAGNTANNFIELTDGTQTNQLQKTSIAITNPISNGTSSFSANGLTLQTDDPALSSAGISLATFATQANISLGVAGLPSPPYPAPDASIGMGVNTSTYNPTISLYKSAPFQPTETLTFDINNIIHNNTGSNNLGISSTNAITLAGDNVDLSSAGRLVLPSLASADYLDYNAGTLNLKSNNVGYTTDRMLLLENTNATAGNTTGVPTFEMYKSGRNGAINDVVSSIQFNANDGAGTKRTFGKIESTITTNTAPANYDGALDFYSLINGVNNLVFRLNGADNENNSFRPFDLNGNELKTSTGDLLINSTASTGTGNITINSKGSIALTSVANDIDLNSNTTIQASKTLSLSKSATIVSTQVLNGESIVNTDFTNSNTATLNTNALTFLNSGGASTIYNDTGFQDITNNSISCNTSNGFRLINGTNTSTHNQSIVEIYNNDTTQDTILLQNTGGGNPVFNLVSNNTGTFIQEQAGTSVNSIGFLRTDTSSGQYQSFSFDNNSASGGVISFNSTLNAFPMVLSTNRDLQMDISQDLVFNGANIESPTSSGNSGIHLRIKLNGVYYKIALQND